MTARTDRFYELQAVAERELGRLVMAFASLDHGVVCLVQWYGDYPEDKSWGGSGEVLWDALKRAAAEGTALSVLATEHGVDLAAIAADYKELVGYRNDVVHGVWTQVPGLGGAFLVRKPVRRTKASPEPMAWSEFRTTIAELRSHCGRAIELDDVLADLLIARLGAVQPVPASSMVV